MSRLIPLTVLTLFVSPAFSQFSQTQSFQRACDLRNCQCGQENIPYCGTNEITYSNICQLECAQRQCDQNIRVKFEGVCAEKYVHDDGSRRSQVSESRNNFVAIRPPVYRAESPRLPATYPTRGPSGNRFEYGTSQSPSRPTNISQFSQTQIFQRTCDLRNCQCSQENIPYCGTNEITYSNICQLKCAQRECDQNIRVKFEGVCAEKYVHDGSGRSQVLESRNNFVSNRPPLYRPESPRLPATIPTRRPSGSTFEYGTTQSPSLSTKYVQYGTSQFPTTTYYNHEVTTRPTNYFEYRSPQKSSTNYFEYRPSTKRPVTNSFEYSTTPRPYYGGGNIIGSEYGSNGERNEQKNNDQNQIGGQYGDFYDYK